MSIMHGLIPCYGRANLHLPFQWRYVDPKEGRTGQGRHGKIPELTWNPDQFKPIAMDLLNACGKQNMYIFARPPNELLRQLVSEEFKDGKWDLRRGYRDNHLWDCFVLACLAARIDQIH
jgi:hypothetical protein